jgi:protease-4
MTSETPSSQRDDRDQAIAELSKAMTDLAHVLAVGKRRENNMRTFKFTAITVAVIAIGLAYVVFYARLFGFQTDPITDAVAVVPVRGPIATGVEASAEQVVPVLQRACRSSRVHTVIVEINSPGGIPAESDRIISAIEACKKGDPENDITAKPVIALIDGVGASAGYMIAMHADEVIAGRYSLVGSIGAIARGLDISKLATEHGIVERVYRSAPLKGGTSMWATPTQEENADNQRLVTDMADVFFRDVLATREGKIKLERDVLFSGRVWTAEQALEYGLIDTVATLEDLQATRFKGMNIHRYQAKATVLEQMGVAQAFRQAMAEATYGGPRF